MAVERLSLPDDQWADIEYRPTHGQIRQIQRAVARARESDATDVEDSLIITLVKEWHVLDKDGNEAPLKKERLDSVPQDVLSLVIDELIEVINKAYPTNARLGI